MGIAGEVISTKTNPFHEGDNLFTVPGRGGKPMDSNRFSDDIPNLHPGVQRRVGVLKDHLNHCTKGQEFVSRQGVQWLPAKQYLTFIRTQQSQEEFSQGRFAASRFTCQAQCLPSIKAEGNSVDRLQGKRTGKRTGFHGKELLYISCFNQGCIHAYFQQRTE